MGTVRNGKKRDRKGSRESETGRQDAKEQAARGTGKQGKQAKGRGRRMAVGTCPTCSFGSGTSHSGFTRFNPVELRRGAVETLNRG